MDVLPNLMVMLRSSSFLKRTVWTPEIALTTVDLPWATWPMVPMLIVAWREITSGDSGVNVAISYNGKPRRKNAVSVKFKHKRLVSLLIESWLKCVRYGLLASVWGYVYFAQNRQSFLLYIFGFFMTWNRIFIFIPYFDEKIAYFSHQFDLK